MTTANSQPAQQWAIVELFGHQRVAGAVSEQVLGGASFVRVDVPEVETDARHFDRGAGRWVDAVETIPAHTSAFGPAAIYAINWCDEVAARVACAGIRHRPITPYTLREAIGNLPAADRQALLTNDGDRPF